MKRLLLIELNEFSVDLFARAQAQHPLPGIARLLKMKHTHTWTDDEHERYGLDPWVQWVSVHSGTDSSEHGIRHLGDVPQRSHRQLWEQLSEIGYTSGVWGAMNAARGTAKNCEFFFPDPWTYSERAYPEQVNRLLDFPRYYSKNYLDLDLLLTVKLFLRLMRFMLSPSLLPRLLRTIPLALKGVLLFGLSSNVLFSVFDLVSTQIFIQYKNRRKPHFSLIFLNSIAHLQHNNWSAQEPDAKCLYSIKVMDRILCDLYNASDSEEELIVMNALSQENVAGRKDDVLYRQKNPVEFLSAMGIRFSRVEQLMTNDGHVLFESKEDARQARQALDEAEIDGTKMFDVEYNQDSPLKLFFQLKTWKRFPQTQEFTLLGNQHNFFQYFDEVVVRTGEHIQKGDIFARNMKLPDQMYNHQVYQKIVDFFAPGTAA